MKKIIFKNGSVIETLESKNNIRSENSLYEFFVNYPDIFAEEYLGLKLMWYQKVYLRLLYKSDKLKERKKK